MLSIRAREILSVQRPILASMYCFSCFIRVDRAYWDKELLNNKRVYIRRFCKELIIYKWNTRDSWFSFRLLLIFNVIHNIIFSALKEVQVYYDNPLKSFRNLTYTIFETKTGTLSALSSFFRKENFFKLHYAENTLDSEYFSSFALLTSKARKVVRNEEKNEQSSRLRGNTSCKGRTSRITR